MSPACQERAREAATRMTTPARAASTTADLLEEAADRGATR
jgi:hypothetical protein